MSEPVLILKIYRADQEGNQAIDWQVDETNPSAVGTRTVIDTMFWALDNDEYRELFLDMIVALMADRRGAPVELNTDGSPQPSPDLKWH